MIPRDQLTLPGFSTVKRLRRRPNGELQLLEYDLVLWREHEAFLNGRSAELPKRPRASNLAATEQWRQLVAQVLAQPIPAIKPIRVWELGRFNGAGVLPWLQGQREPLTPTQVEELKAFLRRKEAVPTALTMPLSSVG